MRNYKIASTVKALAIFTYLFILIGGLIVMFNTKNSLFEQVVIIIAILMVNLGIIAMYHIKINTDEQKIEIFFLKMLAIIFGRSSGITHQILYWNEIGELRGIRTLFAESPIIVLIPKPTVNKKPIEFMGFPLELVKDILSHLPPDAKVSLYPYLKRKLEGKQTWFYVK